MAIQESYNQIQVAARKAATELKKLLTDYRKVSIAASK